MGHAYVAGRNTDYGPETETATAALSPYLRRRLVLEQEIVDAARGAHGPAAEKFVQEVFWRTYFNLALAISSWADGSMGGEACGALG